MEAEEPRIAVLQCVIEEQEIRGVIHHFPSGPVQGYEWRLRVTYPQTAGTAARSEWLPWVFGSAHSVQAMLQQWSAYLEGPGNLHRRPPGSTVQ